ncbi:uncharacterized protein LOC62_04G005306 [Vanrija pseudolonga]|uniref:Uncharacterized protein n=1 Tax=Vanrija pseudolonga TaxID=143232 RepID=A0AAF0Y810_9TREE|nr:hypothetical protein LOC62_04G005306 [Vanrija pseudolonga]
MAPSIDHTAFPAIVVNIIQHADLKTQLVFCRTSKQLCALIDKKHFKHALLTDFEPPRYYIDFPSLPTFPPHADRYPVLYRAVQVVDVKLAVDPPSSIYQLDGATSVHTIRRIGWVSTLAQFVLPDDLRTVVDFVDAADYMEGPRITVSSTQERHILHIRWDHRKCNEECIPCISFNLNGPSINLKEFVIALWAGDLDGDEITQTLLHIVLDLASYLQFVGKMKIVGLERTAIGGEASNFQTKVKVLRQHLLAGVGKLPKVKNHAEELDRAITFLTFDEWWKELGQRKETEGVWNPLAKIDDDDDSTDDDGTDDDDGSSSESVDEDAPLGPYSDTDFHDWPDDDDVNSADIAEGMEFDLGWTHGWY